MVSYPIMGNLRFSCVICEYNVYSSKGSVAIDVLRICIMFFQLILVV